MGDTARRKRLLVYSAVFGGYDDIWDHSAVCDFADYVFITDQPVTYPGMWKVVQFDDIVPAGCRNLDNTRKGRFVKWNPHLLFPEYEYSLYLDGALDIIDEKVFEKLSRFMREGVKISIRVHTECNCVYREAERILELAYDDKATLDRWRDFLRKENFPRNYGLWETGLLFRRHNDAVISALGAEVWDIVANYSKRDQLALPYVVRKQGADIRDFNEGKRNFTIYERFDGCFLFSHKKYLRQEYRRLYWQQPNELERALAVVNSFLPSGSWRRRFAKRVYLFLSSLMRLFRKP